MTVCFRTLLVPSDRSVAPGVEAIARLVEALRRDRWVEDGWAEPFVQRPESRRARFEKRVALPTPLEVAWLAALRDPRRARDDAQADELCLRFPVSAPDDDWETLGLPYPFDRGADEPGYHDVLIQASRDLVRPLFGDREPLRCACSEDLAYDVDERLVLAPIEGEGRVRSVCPRCGARPDPNAPEARARALYRFAVIVDCQEGWPRERDSQEQQHKAAILRAAGYEVTDAGGRPVPPPAPPRPGASDDAVVRSPYGDAAPGLNPALRALVASAIGAPCDVIPEFT